MELIMKKITLVTILAVGLSSAASMTANANDGAGFHTSLESGVKVYRGAPLQINHQAVASYKALELKERKIENQNRQAQAKLKSQNRIAQGRLDLDRRIAFTDNEIFSQRRSRFGGQRFVTTMRRLRIVDLWAVLLFWLQLLIHHKAIVSHRADYRPW